MLTTYLGFGFDSNVGTAESYMGKRLINSSICLASFSRCNWTSSSAAVTLIVFTTLTTGFPLGAESNAAFLYRR